MINRVNKIISKIHFGRAKSALNVSRLKWRSQKMSNKIAIIASFLVVLSASIFGVNYMNMASATWQLTKTWTTQSDFETGTTRVGVDTASTPGSIKITNNTNEYPVAIDGTYEGTLVLMNSGNLYARGISTDGQLGVGTSKIQSDWKLVLTDVSSFATGYNDSYAIKTDGSLWVSGKNQYGELGLGHTNKVLSWTNTGLSGISKVAVGGYHALALTSTHTLYGTGYDSSRQLSNGGSSVTSWTSINISVISYNSEYIVDLSAGRNSSCLVTATNADGTGTRNLWEAGVKSASPSYSSWTKTISGGVSKSASPTSPEGNWWDDNTFVLKTDGSLLVAGSGWGGVLGVGDTNDRPAPALNGGLVISAPATISTESGIRNFAISPDGKSAYIANYGRDTISMYSRNTSTGALTAMSPATIAAGLGPRSITVSPDGTSVYVTNYGNSTISMYSRNTSTGALTVLSPATIATGANSRSITVSPDGTSVYVANYDSNTISMYSRNTSTGALTAMSPATINTGASPIGIIISPDGTSVYVANSGSNTISMYSRNTSTGALTAMSPATIATGSYPISITISPDGTSVYATNYNSNTISMYSRNTSTGALTALSPATISTGSSPNSITISADGTSVYTANYGSSTVSMYSRNTSTGALTALSPSTVTTGLNPSSITISPDGISVYVVNANNNTVSVYSRNSWTQTASDVADFTVGGEHAIIKKTNGGGLYGTGWAGVGSGDGRLGNLSAGNSWAKITVSGLSDSDIGSVSASWEQSYIIDTINKVYMGGICYPIAGALTALSPATIVTGNTPHSITISPDGTSVYVTSANNDNTISMYSRNTSTGALTALASPTIATGSSPRAITISADGTSVYVANYNSSTVSMYSRNTSNGALTAMSPATIAAGSGPFGITISADGTSVYVANYAASTISMYSRNTSTGALTALSPATIATGSVPRTITISADGTSVYATNYNSNTISMYSRNTYTGALTALSPATISTGSSPNSITISADGTSVYVTNSAGNSISMYSRNTSTGALTAMSPATISTGAGPNGITISADGTSVYAANFSNSTISMYSRNTSTGALTAISPATISTGSSPLGINISPDGTSVYAANFGGNTISMYSIGYSYASVGRFVNSTDSIFVSTLTGSVSGLTIDAGVGNLYKWENASIYYQKSGNSSANLQYRTGSSPANLASASWSSVQSCSANSSSTCLSVNAISRLIEFKVNLTTSAVGSIAYNIDVQSISLSYMTDTTPPINPTSAKAYTNQSQTSEITGVMASDPYIAGNPTIYTVYSSNSSPSFRLYGATEEIGGSGLSSSGYNNYAVINKDPSKDPYYAFIQDGFCQNAIFFDHNISVDGLPVDDPNRYDIVSSLSDIGDIWQNCYGNNRQDASGTYYLNVRMSDNAGNMAALDSSPLLKYVYDPVAPTAPSSLTVDTEGWSAPDPKVYTFTWDASDDPQLYDNTVGSGVAGYQYKVDGDINDWSSFTTTTDTTFTLSGDQVQDGEHTIYVRSIDNTGNISLPVSVKYKYNGTAPTSPLGINVSPQSSDTNLFTFNWHAPSGYLGTIKGFRYSINASPNLSNTTFINISSAISTNEDITSSTNLPAGFYYNANTEVYTLHKLNAASKQGSNTFYVVAVGTPDGYTDQVAYGDGNVSQINFTINSSAPEPPKSLKIIDTSNRYALPTPVYSVTLSWIEPNNKNNLSGYYIKRAVPEPLPDGTVTTCDNLTPGTFQIIGFTNTNSFMDAGLNAGPSDTPLASSCYFYQVIAKDDSGKLSWDPSDALHSYDPSSVGVDAQKSIVPTGRYNEPPVITSGPTVDAKVSTAFVSWETRGISYSDVGTPIGNNDGEHKSSSFVEFGTDPISVGCDSPYGTIVGHMVFDNKHEVELSGLKPDTTYHYRVRLNDIDNSAAKLSGEDIKKGCSADQTFRTQPAPRIQNVTIQDVRLYAALLTWYTSEPVNSDILYGQNTSYSKTISDVSGGKATIHSVLLTGLQDSSTYHFAIRMYDGSTKNETTGEYDYQITSDDYTFETLKFPRISNVQFQPLSDQATAAFQISWDTNVPTTSVVQFKPDGGVVQESVKTKLETKHTITLNGLFDNTYYLMNALGVDQFGNTATSDAQRIKTAYDTRPPVIDGVTTEVSNTEFGTAAKSQIVVSWQTDEPGTSQVEYDFGVTGESYGSKTQEDATLTTSHVVVLTDLRPSSAYHLRAVSRDASGNKGVSEQQSVLTEQARSSVLDVILNSLQSSLGWIFGLGK